MNLRAVFSISFVAAVSTMAMVQPNNTLRVEYTRKVDVPELAGLGGQNVQMVNAGQLEEKHFILYSEGAESAFVEGKMVKDEQKIEVKGVGAIYLNLENGVKLTWSDMVGDAILVKTDSIKPQAWKLGEEAKTILGKPCRKATCTLANGQECIAWFCEEIPATVGPSGYFGLPGLIMELQVARLIYKAEKVEYLSDKVAIVPPPSDKAVTQAEYMKRLQQKLGTLQKRGERASGQMQVIKL